MKTSPIKKLIKFLFFAIIIGVVVFFGVKLIFPKPNELDAYTKTQQLLENEISTSLKQVTGEVINLMEEKLDDETLNLQTLYKLKISSNIFATVENANMFQVDKMIFAENGTIYDSNVKQLNSLFEEINSKYSSINDYIETYVTPFLNETEKTTVSLNSYALTLFQKQIEIDNMLVLYNTGLVNIFHSLQNSYTVNIFSKDLLSITNSWLKSVTTEIANEETSNFEQLKNNSFGLLQFSISKLNDTVARMYFTANEEIADLVLDISKTDIAGLVANIFGDEEDSYINSITNQDIKNATISVANFLKGVIIWWKKFQVLSFVFL